MTNDPQPKEPFNMAAFANAVLASQFPERPATVEPLTRCRHCGTIVTKQRHVDRHCCGQVDCLLADAKRGEASELVTQ